MSDGIYIAKAYLLLNCPFSLKFLLFMTEAGLIEKIKIITFDKNRSDYESKKLNLEELLGKDVSFPTVEIKPGTYEFDSDVLIDHYSKKIKINSKNMRTLEFYKNGIFKEVIRLFIENKELKSSLMKT